MWSRYGKRSSFHQLFCRMQRGHIKWGSLVVQVIVLTLCLQERPSGLSCCMYSACISSPFEAQSKGEGKAMRITP